MSSVARWFVGIDLHRKSMQVQVLDGQGKPAEAHSLKLLGPADRARALKLLGRRRSGGRYAVEALGMNRWLVNGMQGAGMDVVVVDPTKLGLKAFGKKTDRKDALEIARRLWLGDIDASARTYFPDDTRYGRRKVLRSRKKLVGERTRCVNQIRAILNAYGLEAPPGSLYHPPSRQWLREASWPTEELGLVARSWLSVMEVVHAEIQGLEARIGELASTGLAADLQQYEGIGPVTALTLVEELAEWDRFHSARAAASYTGLVPRVTQSAERTRYGQLTRRGNPELRHLLGQWAVRLLSKHDSVVETWAKPKLRYKSKNVVRTILARKLLVGLLASYRKGEPFDLDRCLHHRKQ